MWQKLRHIFAPDNNYDWMVSHAANPFAEHVDGSLYRVYFTCRNKDSQSHIGSVLIDMDNDFKVLDIPCEPVLGPGEDGIFDDSGVAMGFLANVQNRKFLYYLGWNLKVTVPWLNTIGLAIWNDKTSRFEKHSRAPMMDRSHEDPFSISYPSVLFDEGKYRMWYGSNLRWGKTQYEMAHVVKYAESADGIRWDRKDVIHVGLEHPNEYALSKPFVLKDGGAYKMWYSYRANGDIDAYRIGYATSADGHTWTRKDANAGIDVSASDWDSEMICYPFVFRYKDEMYMLYNGNGYGRTGFGIAKWK